MAITYEKIATTTLGSATASTTFSSISSAYTDLVLVTLTKMSGIGQITLQFNDDTATNYSYTEMYGNGTSALTDRGTNVNKIYFGNTINSTTVFTAGLFNIQNYVNSTNYKSIISCLVTPSVDLVTNAATWRSTSAITSIKVLTSSSTFTSGSIFTLYGIKAA